MRSVKTVTLLATAEKDETGNNRSSAIDCTGYSEGSFVLVVAQGTYGNETIDVVVETYNTYTETWHTIGSFSQVGDATTTQRQLLNIFALGSAISCSWTIAGMDTGKEYTISVSGTLKT